MNRSVPARAAGRERVMAETAEESTKMQILRLLKTNGGLEAKAIAEACGLTTMAVRRHLLNLRAGGLIQMRTERRPKGRPTTVHSLTELGDAEFPRDYQGLACELLSSLHAHVRRPISIQILNLGEQRTCLKR